MSDMVVKVQYVSDPGRWFQNTYLSCWWKPYYNLFDRTLKCRGLFLTNREPTRGRSCLDTIATSLLSWDYSVEVGDSVVADNCPLIMKLSFELVNVNHNITAWFANYTGSARFIREESFCLYLGRRWLGVTGFMLWIWALYTRNKLVWSF